MVAECVPMLCLLNSIQAVSLQYPQPQTIQLHTLYIMALSTKQYKYIQGVPGKVSLRMFLNWTASSDIVSPLIDSSQEHERACPHSTNSEGYFFSWTPYTSCLHSRNNTNTRPVTSLPNSLTTQCNWSDRATSFVHFQPNWEHNNKALTICGSA